MMEQMLTVLAALEGGGAVSSKVCYHVALSGAGGKWGMGGGVFAGYEIGKKNGDVGVEGACGEKAGAEFKFKAAERGSFDAAFAGVNGPRRADSHSTHDFESKRSRRCWALLGKTRRTRQSALPLPVRRECKITWNKEERTQGVPPHTSTLPARSSHVPQLISPATKHPLVLINEQ